VEEAVFAAHSGTRYLVLAAAGFAAVAALIGSRQRRAGSSGLERVLGIVFISVLDLQVLLGIVLLTLRPFYGALIGHIVLMIGALVSAHVGSIVARKRATTGTGSRVRLRSILIALVFVVAGITALNRPVF